MSNYSIDEVKSSTSVVLTAGLAVLMLNSPVIGAQVDGGTELKNQERHFEVIGTVSSSVTSSQNFEVSKPSDNFEGIVSSFYSDLLISQQKIGSDFEKVLFDNIEELYES